MGDECSVDGGGMGDDSGMGNDTGNSSQRGKSSDEINVSTGFDGGDGDIDCPGDMGIDNACMGMQRGERTRLGLSSFSLSLRRSTLMAYLVRFASGSVFLGEEVAVAQGMPGSSWRSLETAAERVSVSSLQWATVAAGGTAASSA